MGFEQFSWDSIYMHWLSVQFQGSRNIIHANFDSLNPPLLLLPSPKTELCEFGE
jgi:hypothetical protein